jgi:site-specific DNA-methyltransferase (adenine-specific)
MHLNESNGYWYARRYVDGEKETVAKLGQHEDRPRIYRPQLEQDKAANVLRRLPDDSVDALITDPPYGISFESGRSEYDGASDLGGLANDTDESLDFLEPLSKELHRVLKPESWAYIFCRGDVLPTFAKRLKPEFTDYRTLVWYKIAHGMGDLSDWAPSHELILAYRRGGAELRGGRPQDTIQVRGMAGGVHDSPVQIHPTQKPRELMERLIVRSTAPGDLVLDPFGGSYATARAAQRKFRQCVACELDPETHRAAASLTESELHDDPEYGCDWTDVSGLEVSETSILRPMEAA